MTTPELVPPHTWEATHAGDIVLGHDNQAWGIVELTLGDPRGPIVTLTRYGQQLVAQPPPGTPITVITPVDTAPEARVFDMFINAGFTPEVIRESVTL